MDNVQDLISYLRRCSDHYYNTGEPLISDAEYDSLIQDLKRMSPGNPFFSEVGAPPRGGYKVKRTTPMGTLSKIYKEDALEKYLSENHDDLGYIVAPKYDGFGVELSYDDSGKLVSASTRGDGYEGDSVLEAVSSMGLPIKDDRLLNVTVRGEAIIPRKYHEEIERLGYKAMRNAVPGIVRSARKDALQYVHFIAYEFIPRDNPEDTRSEQRLYYEGLFRVEDHRLFSIEEKGDIYPYITQFLEKRDDYEYEIDGVVIKTNTIRTNDDYLHPKQMVAYKPKSGREITTLRDIEYQLGATGKFTPIGIFDPVEFQGATLTRASLGSMARLASFEFRPSVGSTIEVSRRGDIIPYIEDINDTVEGKEFGPLLHCPHCYVELARDHTGEVMCANALCPEILRLKITQFVKGMKVKGIGDGLVKALINSGHVKSIANLYEIDPEIAGTLPGFGPSAVEKLRELQSKSVSLVEFFSAYPFENLGEAVWKTVFSRFTVSNIIFESRGPQAYEGLKGLGESKINSIVTQLDANRAEIRHILSISTVVAPPADTVQ